ncbi:MAG TPA: GntR family transcriptional regulator [Candidatus Dormibacteraeota bacterium]|nr:GntR family transcriptional regulator [Candidatus Dormibacteraeota bacterium]
MVESVGGTSLAFRAREAILHSILERRFEDSRLPPENELADMLGVSRTTVRSALQSLEQHGVLTRSPRRGTQVHGRLSPSMVALQRLIGFTRLLEEQGYSVETLTDARITTSAPDQVIKALAVPKGTPIYEIDRLFVASGKPAIWAINYIQVSLFAEPPRDDQLAQSPFDMGDLLVGGPVDNALVEIVPRKANADVAKQLGLKPAEAYLLLKEMHFSESGAVLGFSLIHVNDHFVRFRLHRGGDGR